MGELIRVLKKKKLNGFEFEIELNKPTLLNADYDIHIQNRMFRLELSDRDFLEVASAMRWAKTQLLSYKERRGEDE